MLQLWSFCFTEQNALYFCRIALIILLLVIVYVVLAFVCHGLTLPSCLKWGQVLIIIELKRFCISPKVFIFFFLYRLLVNGILMFYMLWQTYPRLCELVSLMLILLWALLCICLGVLTGWNRIAFKIYSMVLVLICEFGYAYIFIKPSTSELGLNLNGWGYVARRVQDWGMITVLGPLECDKLYNL